jgi:hypothetical protein
MRTFIGIAALSFTVSASATVFSMGSMPPIGTFTVKGSPLTMIDLSHPATTAGTVTKVSVRYLGTPVPSCTSTFKVKFLHPDSGLASFTVIAERGPFPALFTAPLIDVAISPGVDVVAGDLLAITQTPTPATCSGGVMVSEDQASSITLQSAGDLQSGTFTNMTRRQGQALNALATTVANEPGGIFTVVGAAQGVGAFFRTSVQLANPNLNTTMSGKLVYHPQGQSASPSDPSINYSIGPRGVWSEADVVTKMGLSGIGSMDLVPSAGGVPVAVTRIFNDRGSDGTDGFVEPLLRTTDAMSNFMSGTIVLPNDLSAFRVNVGIRTLDAGATLSLYYTSPNDAAVQVDDQKFDPNYFIQMPLATLLGTTAYKANGIVGVQMAAGAAIVYVSIIDAKTGDSSVYFLSRR